MPPSASTLTATDEPGEVVSLMPQETVQSSPMEAFGVPGSFVVLQGMPGDGMANTIDSMPRYEHAIRPRAIDEEESAVMSFDSSSDEEIESRRPPQVATTATTTATVNPVTAAATGFMAVGGYNSLPQSMLPPLSTTARAPTVAGGGNVVTTHVTTTVSTTRHDLGAEHPDRLNSNAADVGDDSFVVVDSSSSPPPPMTSTTSTSTLPPQEQEPCPVVPPELQRAIQLWQEECRAREAQQMQDVDPSSSGGWWQRHGKLVIFEHLPRPGRIDNSSRGIVTELSPGTTVVAMELIKVRGNLGYDPSRDNTNQDNSRELEEWHFLRIESPRNGYVLLRNPNGYTYLASGLPSSFGDPYSWTWRVTCLNGAYVRDGLELSSHHVATIPHGSFLKVTRKTVNIMGLTRLRVRAMATQAPPDTTSSTTSAMYASDANSEDSSSSESSTDDNDSTEMMEPAAPTIIPSSSSSSPVLITGWISEALNPLSGLRGPIAQPLPLPLPFIYKVTLPEGAVVRSDVELSSPQIGLVPFGQHLTVVARAFTQAPQDQCIERLKLAGGAGWVSVRLNYAPPMNDVVVAFVDVDGSFDPDNPGLWHLEAQRKVAAEAGAAAANNNLSSSQSSGGSGVGGEISSIDERASSCNSSTISPPVSATGRFPRHIPQDVCLICLTEERNSTIVHGETGHIACCLACARILKARGDRCPVCRMSIDSVIQQFWA